MRISDWSSDVCSSDLFGDRAGVSVAYGRQQRPIVPREQAPERLDRTVADSAGIAGRVALAPGERLPLGAQVLETLELRHSPTTPPSGSTFKIGRESWQERVCSYVEMSVDASSLQKKK